MHGGLEVRDPIYASRILVDPYSARILVSVSKKAKSVQQISEECSIPIAVCYRRVRELEKAGYIKCVGRALTREGKRVSLYKTHLCKADIKFENGVWRAVIIFEDGAMFRLP